jgi:hypothetical protein
MSGRPLASSGSPMKLTMLDGGHFTSAAGLWRRGEDMECQVRFPIPVYLIEAGSERILIDAGLHPAAAADAESHYAGAVITRKSESRSSSSMATTTCSATARSSFCSPQGTRQATSLSKSATGW